MSDTADVASGAASDSLVGWDYWQNDWPRVAVACTRANAADAFPLPMTPLSLDLVVRFEDAGAHHLYEKVLRSLRKDQAPDPFVRAVYGLVYFDAEQLAAIGDGTPGTSRAALYEQFFGLQRDPDRPPPPADVRQELSNARRVLPRLIWIERTLPRRIDRLTAKIRAARPAASQPSLAECREWLARLDDSQIESWWVLTVAAMLVAAHFEVIVKLLARWAGDETGELTNRLHVNLGGNESAEAGRAVGRLARIAQEEGGPVSNVADAGPRFAAAFAEAIARFGHRGPRELELSMPSWRADPSRLLDLVTAHMSSPQATNIAVNADAELASRLKPWQRPIAGAVLARSRAWMPRRENAKTPLTVLWDELRRLIDCCGAHLVAAGAIARVDDLHYLRRSELDVALAGGDVPPATEILRRRAAYDRCLDVDLPELIELGPGFVRALPDAYLVQRGLVPPTAMALDNVTELRGLGVAAGVHRGRARVMADADEPFDPDDILFAYTVDPGWSPVIAMAGAIVLDVGGPMSHGAVVARELGIPCVINVKAGTRVVSDGATVTVDGSHGIVHIEEAP